jgi:hypothetical protein
MGQDLSDLKWEKRVLLLMDAENEVLLRSKQLRILSEFNKEIEERDLVIYVYAGDRVLDRKGNSIPMDVKAIPYREFQGVILIGKDGGVKSRYKFITDPKVIFDRIDAMPMRQSEIKASGKY